METIKKLIAENQLEEALSALHEKAKNTSYESEVFTLRGWATEVSRHERLKTLSSPEITAQKNNIRKAVVDILLLLREKDKTLDTASPGDTSSAGIKNEGATIMGDVINISGHYAANNMTINNNSKE